MIVLLNVFVLEIAKSSLHTLNSIESEIIMKYSMLSERRDSSKHLFKPRWRKKNRKKNEEKMPHSFKCIWVFRNIISNRITTSIGMPTVEILKANPIYTIHLNSIHINTPKQHKWHTLPALPTLSHRLLSFPIFCLFYFLCCCCCFVLFCIFGNLDSFLFFFE